jgi:enterochelin esterase-like enzyme
MFGYPKATATAKKYAVLYMHDGQMLYDSTTTWNKQEWGVDEVLSKLINNHEIKNCIVVGIWNGGKLRHSEYFPQKPFEALSPNQQDTLYKATRSNGQILFADKVQSDNYLKFLVTELKPFIDQSFSTYKNQANTFVAGSSMGGLISMYAICEYPKVFGGAACLSTHWTGIFRANNNPIPEAFMHYLRTNLPSPKKHKIYFDYGTATLDALYKPFQEQADAIMKQKGIPPKTGKPKSLLDKTTRKKLGTAAYTCPSVFCWVSEG